MLPKGTLISTVAMVLMTQVRRLTGWRWRWGSRMPMMRVARVLPRAARGVARGSGRWANCEIVISVLA